MEISDIEHIVGSLNEDRVLAFFDDFLIVFI